ncbi:hypothetical protein ACWCPQ_14530 [Nocardia sp. NPDC001965]
MSDMVEIRFTGCNGEYEGSEFVSVAEANRLIQGLDEQGYNRTSGSGSVVFTSEYGSSTEFRFPVMITLAKASDLVQAPEVIGCRDEDQAITQLRNALSRVYAEYWRLTGAQGLAQGMVKSLYGNDLESLQVAFRELGR